MLQGARHRSEYSHEANYDGQKTLAAIDKAEDAICQFEGQASITVADLLRSRYSSDGCRRRSDMGKQQIDEQQIREIAENAFKTHFNA